MCSVFQCFNLFSQTPSLKINGNIRPNLIFGSIIGFITISILIVGFCIILYDYFSYMNFNVNYLVDNLAHPKIKLDNFKISLTLGDLKGVTFPDHDRLFTISAIYWDVDL
jgi:hypothetical protein